MVVKPPSNENSDDKPEATIETDNVYPTASPTDASIGTGLFIPPRHQLVWSVMMVRSRRQQNNR
jgi:hypothetical protein